MIKIIHNLELLVIEIVLWIILLPKTLFSVLFFPIKMTEYLQSELEKVDVDRFNEHISPITFLILLGPLLNVIVVHIIEDGIPPVILEFVMKIYMILLLVGPLGFTLAMQMFIGGPVSKKNLAKFFSIQCYFFGAFYLIINCSLLMGAIAVSLGHEGSPTIGFCGGIICLASLIWLSSTEIKITKLFRLKYSPYLFLAIGWFCVISLLAIFFSIFLLYITKFVK